jgi:putative DNA primase/helicase
MSGATRNGHLDPLTAALAYRAAGLAVIPIRRDGSKAPACGAWKRHQEQAADEAQLRRWFGGANPPGVAVICGDVSGGLECLDFDAEAEAVFPAWRDLVEAESPGLFARLSVARTPRGGYHVRYRCPGMPIPGNTKLATDLGKKAVLIETRGEGGYALAPGCPADCHLTGRLYEHHNGPHLERVQAIGIEERDILIRCARSFDRSPPPEPTRPPAERGPGLSPGDEYEQRGPDWPAILEPHGWVAVHQRGPVTYWRRPGKDGAGWSATTGVCTSKAGRSLFYVFSANAAPFEPNKGYSRFACYALLNHGGDFSAAARALAGQGYGDRQARRQGPRGQAKDKPPGASGGRASSPAIEPGDGEVVEAEDDRHRLAGLFIADHTRTDGRAIHYWREEWYEWDGTAYRVVPDKEMQARLCRRIKEEFDRLNKIAVQKWQDAGGVNGDRKPVPKPCARKVTARLTSDVKHALASLTLLPAARGAPAWLEGDSAVPFPAGDVLACRNALVYLAGVGSRQNYRVAPTPRFFSANALDYDFDPQAPQPHAWLEFLKQLWPDDQKAVEALQEWFGYCLLPDTSQHKILMIVGPKRSGKGTIARVLRGVVGIDNTAGPTLASLGTNFGLWPLLDKTLAIISDARLSGRSDAAVIVERLLSISGEDAQTVDRKNMRPVTARLPTRFVILTNELPKLNDPSGALVGRMVLLRQTKSWYGQEDHRLTDKVLRERPGLLLWAVEGWRRLRERGRFIQPESGLKLVRELEDLSSPIGAFLREHCVIGPGLEAPVKALFQRWQGWCESVGRKDPGNEQTFGRDLRAAVPGLDDRQPRQGDGTRHRVYVGIALRADEPSGWAPP